MLVRPAANDMAGLNDLLCRSSMRRWHSVRIPDDAIGTPAQRLHAGLGLAGSPNDATAETLSAEPSLHRAVLELNPSRLGAAGPVSDFLRAFGRLSAGRPMADRVTTFCVASPSELHPVPITDAGLVVRWTWGIVGPLDTRVVIDETMPGSRVIGDVEVVSELATFDLALGHELAQRYNGDARIDLRASLAAISGDEMVGPTSSELDALGGFGLRADAPPSDLRSLWDRGMVDWWGDQPVIHSRFLSQQEITTRVWRGQVSAVLPFVEFHRARLAKWVVGRRAQLSQGWESKDLAALEAGPLWELMRKNPSLRQDRSAWQVASALKVARHSLAHLEPVSRTWLGDAELLLRTTPLR